MATLDYTGLNTTLRIYETYLLSESDFENLLDASSIDEALQLVDKTVYNVPNDIHETKDFDGFLLGRLAKVYEELASSVDDTRVLELYSLRYTYHNLKVLLKGKLTNQDLSDLIIPIGSYSVEQLRHMIETGEKNNLPTIMVNRVRDVFLEYEEYGRLDSIDILLDTAYMAQLKEIADDFGDEEVSKVTNMVIDFENLSTLVRANRQGQSRSFINAVLSRHGSISKADLLGYLDNKDLHGLISRFQATSYGEQMEDILNRLETEGMIPTVIDRAIQEVIAERFREYSLTPFGPMPTLTYLYFLENEIANLRLILTGKENLVDEAVLRERMRPIYGI